MNSGADYDGGYHSAGRILDDSVDIDAEWTHG
jgi:hypothetical protein